MSSKSLLPNVTVFSEGFQNQNSVLKSYNYNKIKMWTGSTPPTGYRWCDGANNTPDLRNRFIYFVHHTDTDLSFVGNNTITGYPTHNHNVSSVNTTTSVNATTNTIKINQLKYKLITLTGSPNPSGGIKRNNNGSANAVSKNHTHSVNNTNSGGSTFFKDDINFSNFTINGGISLSKPNLNVIDNTTSSQEEYLPKYIYMGYIMRSP